VVRHALPDRLFHWLTALSVLTLLGTAFLPILGLKFAWVTPHWIAGVVLTLAVLFHIARATSRERIRSMWIGAADLRDAVQFLRWNLRRAGVSCPKPGKYSLAQKIFHHVILVIVLTAMVTGLMMMVRIDTPFWQRNPYWLAEDTWGVVYVLHDLAALCLITLSMIHVYFALRPDKLFYTRSMLKGWITEEEKREHHDAARWQ
jgi:cytochrome b subunit of formate dehydrogenase